MYFKNNTIKYLIVASLFSCNLNSLDKEIERINEFENRDEFKKAILEIDKSLIKFPNNIELLISKGVNLSAIKKYNEAILCYSKVIQIDSNNSMAYLNRGRNYNRISRNTKALNDYDKIIKLKSVGVFYIDLVENPYTQTNLSYEVNIVEVKHSRGIALYEMDSLKEAFKEFDFCIENKYELSSSYYWRGLIYISYEMFKEGCLDINSALENGNNYCQDIKEKYCQLRRL